MASARDRAMFGLMVGAGLRVGEVASLRLDCLEPPAALDELARLTVKGKGEKERVVWVTGSLWADVNSWLGERPAASTGRVFLNWRGQPITTNGIQYCFRRHCDAAGVTLNCHQLRHTYARRLAESGLPVESLARLLGHSLLQTTQRYIDGANPALCAEFAGIMAKLETTLIRDKPPTPLPPRVAQQMNPSRSAPESELLVLRQRLEELPTWLAEPANMYLSWRWPTWREQTASRLGSNFLSVLFRLWRWLEANCHVDGWATFGRGDLQAWLISRLEDGVSLTTVRNDLAQFRSLLKFLEDREQEVDPGLFRVRPPRQSRSPLPRYLSESDYGWLETNILQATRDGSCEACFDRAWFLTLSHTGMRLSELLTYA